MEVIYQNNNGKIVHSDNIEAMKRIKENSVDSCISDFPYDLSFMGKKWDTTGNFYEWCKARAIELHRIMKSGGYVCIFGHPKTNHRMKSAFEDAGFNIVEEIDWVYLSGFPKNQDIGKMFDKKAGIKREIIGETKGIGKKSGETYSKNGGFKAGTIPITIPATKQAKIWNGWKTSGLKPAHEPITVFQKPIEKNYCYNIEKYGCGGMNIDACRVPVNPDGRFPPNIIMDECVAEEFDEQTGDRKGGTSNGNAEVNVAGNGVTPLRRGTLISRDDSGGGSRMFPIIKYCRKVSPKERLLPNGERNPHVTLKPVELIKWLIKLVTPINGKTIDITAGSCTHAVACEQLNQEGYNLHWLNIEMMNTEAEPYCNTGKIRVEAIYNNNIK